MWLRDGVAQGGVSVGFDVGERVFMLGGVSVPVSGSSPAVSGLVSVSGGVVLVSPDAGVGASGSSGGVGGVRVCVSCAVRVFGVSWCSLVVGVLAWAAGVDGVKVVVLLGSALGFDSGPVVSGGVVSSRGGVVSSGLLFSRLRLFPVVLCPCVRLLVVGVLVWGLGRVLVGGCVVWFLVLVWCLVVVWLLVGGSVLVGGCVVWFLVLAWGLGRVCAGWCGGVGECARVGGVGGLCVSGVCAGWVARLCVVFGSGACPACVVVWV